MLETRLQPQYSSLSCLCSNSTRNDEDLYRVSRFSGYFEVGFSSRGPIGG